MKRSSPAQLLLATLLLAGIGPTALAAPATTTRASEQSESAERPVSTENAKIYIGFGRDFLIQLSESERVLGALSLSADQKQQAAHAVSEMRQQLNGILAELASERRPSSRRVFDVPNQMKAMQQQIQEVIGPDLTKQLRARFDSPQSRTRYWVLQVQGALPTIVQLIPDQQASVAAVFNAALQQADRLPAVEVATADLPAATEAATEVCRFTRSELYKLLTPEQQATLTQRYRDLDRGAEPGFRRPTSRPAAP